MSLSSSPLPKPEIDQDNESNGDENESDTRIHTTRTSLFSLCFYPHQGVKDFLNDIKKRLDKIKTTKPEIIYKVGLSDKITIEGLEGEEEAKKMADNEGIYGILKNVLGSIFSDKPQLKSEVLGEDSEGIDENIETAIEGLKEPICIYIIIRGLKIETIGGVRELENTLSQLEFFV